MSKPLYQPGLPIRSLIAFIGIAEEKRPLYYRHKVTTFGWYQNWSLCLITHNIHQRYLREALPAKEGQE